ncbi:MAG: hypothetical protein APF76_09850 [Desulfitibacter sp. BRH_c19]|nr:MAG: hypothetical protein APF76_09850 [Desulfitibacter sp. BRH_c19]
MANVATFQLTYHPHNTQEEYDTFIQENCSFYKIDLLVCPPNCDRYFNSFEDYLSYHKSLAKRHFCMIAPGFFYKDQHHTALLISPNGDIIHQQQQAHLSRWELRQGLKRGTTLETIDTPIGRIGFIIGTDCFYPQIGRILGLQGIDIAIAFYQQPAPYNSWLQMSGVWQQVQHNQFFAVEAGFNGTLGQEHFAAESIIHQPLGENGDGCSQKLKTNQNGFIKCILDQNTLESIKQKFPIYKYLNRTLYQRVWGK